MADNYLTETPLSTRDKVWNATYERLKGAGVSNPRIMTNNIVGNSYTNGFGLLDLTPAFVGEELGSMTGESLANDNYLGAGLGLGGALLSTVPGGKAATSKLTKPLTQTIDKRFAKSLQGSERVADTKRIQSVDPKVTSYNIQENVPRVSLADFEGRPFITSMSDRTSAQGLLTGVKGKEFEQPVRLLGGQGHMFLNPGQVWASGKNPVNDIVRQAAALKEKTGLDPIYLPWRMAPTGSDFAGMTGETMLNYANVSLTKANKTKLDKQLKNIIPEWAGVGNPKGINQYNSASKVQRDAVLDTLDKNFRDAGGLSIPEARVAITDPAQLNAADSGLMYVGEIFGKQPALTKTGHPSYPFGVPGRGVGILSEDRRAYELLTDKARERNILDPRNVNISDTRALQMKAHSGILTPELLKKLGY